MRMRGQRQQRALRSETPGPPILAQLAYVATWKPSNVAYLRLPRTAIRTCMRVATGGACPRTYTQGEGEGAEAGVLLGP